MRALLLSIMAFMIFCSCKNNQPFSTNTHLTPFDKSNTLSFEPSQISYRLDTFFQNKYKRGGFNGSVLVAKGNTILYQANFGYENFDTKDTLSENSSFQTASVSKTFTATAILRLAQDGLLSLEDTLGKFFPNFPYRNIRIRDLLCHRSGLPNYLHFGENFWKDKSLYMTNEDLINLLTKNPNIEGTFKPNSRFQYCNTNYALLASIVERVSQKRFPDYMQETFFTPLGMSSAWIYDVKGGKTTAQQTAISYNSKWVKQKDDPYDGVYGDKGLYASISDMHKWNMGFYEGKLLNEEWQKEAYAPRSFEKDGVRNYGFGWRLIKQPTDDYLVYHNGWWHGNNTVFYRYIPDTFALVIFSNRYNRSVYNVQPVFNLITGTEAQSNNFVEE